MIGLSAFVAGLVFLLATLACVLVAAAVITRRRLAGLGGAVLAIAYALVATTLLLAVHMVPGALGILSRGTVFGAAAIALVASLLVRAAPLRARPDPPRTERESRVSWVIAIGAVALAGGYGLAYLRHHYAVAPTGIDALSFHLPDVARWIQTGTFWEVDQFLPQLAQGNYPNSGDVVFLAVVLPFKSALLVRWVMVPFLVLTGVAVYAVARELGAPRPAATLFGAALTSVPAVMDPALVSTQTDTLMLFAFGAGLLFLVRHHRTAARSDLVLAGLGLGVAFGTKWYGVTCVVAVLAVWFVATLLATRALRPLIARTLALGGLILLTGGFWLLRNLVESADPFFPARVRVGGLTIFDAPPDVVRQTGGFTVANYFANAHVLRVYILPALEHTLAWLSLLMAVAAIAAGVLALLRRRNWLIVAVAVAALLIAAVYTITPETALGPRNFPVQTSANTRYVVPALILAAALAAWLTGALRRAGIALELAALVLTVDALSRVYALRSGLAIALAVVVFGAGLGFLLGYDRLRGRAFLLYRRRTAAAAALATVLAIFAAFATRRAYDARGYASDATVAWVLQHAPSGHQVGLAGVWPNGLAPIFPSFGPRLGNRVAYVGPFVRHMLQQYPTPGPLATVLRRSRYDLLIVGRGFPRALPAVPSSLAALEAGYREVAASPRLLLYVR